jgi:hypothetical protein
MSEQTISVDRADEFMRAVFEQLQAMGGSGNGTDVLALV